MRSATMSTGPSTALARKYRSGRSRLRASTTRSPSCATSANEPSICSTEFGSAPRSRRRASSSVDDQSCWDPGRIRSITRAIGVRMATVSVSFSVASICDLERRHLVAAQWCLEARAVPLVARRSARARPRSSSQIRPASRTPRRRRAGSDPRRRTSPSFVPSLDTCAD